MSSSTTSDYPRRFVPADADMGDWARIEPLFDALDRRPIDTREQMEAWLLEISELSACLSEEGSKRYVAMTCQTDDPAREAAHLQFIEEIQPKCKPRWHRLRERYVQVPARGQLPMPRYAVYDRGTVAAVELFREENVDLQTEEAKLDQQYQKICGAQTVQHEGREQTLQQMSRYLQQTDRAVRQEAWEKVAARRLQDREAIDAIYDGLIEIRGRIAANAGCADYREYKWKEYERFDYAPADALAFHEAIERHIVPASRAIQRERQETLGVDRLRPWDLSVDPRGRPPLKPFATGGELAEKCSTVFHALSPELGGQFDEMVTAGWLDLESRKGKAPGGYQADFDETRHPFIFMNAVGLQRDVETLLHEGGHAFHAIAARDEPLLTYRHAPIEMAEVASMSMELLTSELLGVFYDGADLKRARREQLEGVLAVFPWIATIDAFQHWIYTHPKHTQAERSAEWLRLMDRFGGIEDWSGYEANRESLWQRQLHLFGVPFYYIEYGIAQIGALQLWQNARRDRAAALSAYRAALALGGSRPLPELWQAAGLRFDFSARTLAPLADALLAELETLK